MGHMSYKRVGISSNRPNRGFRLNPRKFSVSRLRLRFICFFRLLSRLRCSYGHALQALKKGMSRRRRSSSTSPSAPTNIKRNNSSSRRNLVATEAQNSCGRLRSFGRSNSFYAEAIADCLDFIKRSSISVDQNPVVQR